jgi:hypothetical protein
VTARRCRLLLAAIIAIEAGCLYGTWWVAQQDVSA